MENTDTVTLTCNDDTSDSVINYEWYFNDAKKDGETKKTLEIGKTRNAAGKYECKVVTGTETSEKSEEKDVFFLCKSCQFSTGK